ncbi:hypothetical protein [Desulfoluna spongiiphila]|nr:hypothetical protein [Desulfoluna spongiiphila]
MRYMKAGLVMALGVFLLSGCASIVKHDIPVTECQPVSLSTEARGEMTYSVEVHNNLPGSASVSMHGVTLSGSEWTATESEISRGIKRHFSETGYFNTVKEVRDPGDFHIRFDVTMNPSPNESSGSYLAGFTLFLLPVWYSHNCEWAATLYENGQKAESFFSREEVTQVWWLPLLPVGLFKNLATAEKEVAKNYINSLVLELKGKGYLPVRKETTPKAVVAAPGVSG